MDEKVKEKMDKLIELLKNFDYTDKEKYIYNEEIEAIASTIFITNDGRCDWKNMIAFVEFLPGSDISAVEKDSFGWLIGGISYNHHIFTYG